jgi:hypothetical protein
MLIGKRAFAGASAIEVLHAVLYDRPPALTGSPALAVADRVIRRAMEKQPQDRYASARAMSEELREAEMKEHSGVVPRSRAMTRLIVLPFRILRHHEASDFLAVGLPDAITSSCQCTRVSRKILGTRNRPADLAVEVHSFGPSC